MADKIQIVHMAFRLGSLTAGGKDVALDYLKRYPSASPAQAISFAMLKSPQ